MTPAEPWQIAFAISGFALCYLFIGLGQGWLMRALQITVVIAVVISNIQWQWTHSGFLAGLVGVGLAFVLTVPPVLLWDWLRRKTRPGVSRSSIQRKQTSQHDIDLLGPK